MGKNRLGKFWREGEEEWDECADTVQLLAIGSFGEKTIEQGMLMLRVVDLEERLASVERQIASPAVTMPIQTLPGDQFSLVTPILAVIQEDGGAFIASFLDANINASGESQLDAFEGLQATIVSTFALLLRQEASLGDEPQRQLYVLRKFIRAE